MQRLEQYEKGFFLSLKLHEFPLRSAVSLHLHVIHSYLEQADVENLDRNVQMCHLTYMDVNFEVTSILLMSTALEEKLLARTAFLFLWMSIMLFFGHCHQGSHNCSLKL